MSIKYFFLINITRILPTPNFWTEVYELSVASRCSSSASGCFFFGTQRRRSHFFPPRPLPYFPCLLSCIVTSHLLRDSLCIALQTEKLWIWSTGLSTQLTPSSRREAEDIYLFGTMITGLLLIGLGFALGYRRIQKTGTAVQSLTRLPVMIEAVGRAVSIETETINRNMDSIMEKLTALQRKIYGIGDQNGQRE